MSLQGEQFVLHEDWGEALVGKSCPVLCVLDIEGDNVSVLEGVPENISPGQVGTAVCVMMHDSFLVYFKHSHSLLLLLLLCLCLCRHFGLQVTQVWCLWAGGMSLSDLALRTAPTGGDYLSH